MFEYSLFLQSALSWLISEVAKSTKRRNKVDDTNRFVEPMISWLDKKTKQERKTQKGDF